MMYCFMSPRSIRSYYMAGHHGSSPRLGYGHWPLETYLWYRDMNKAIYCSKGSELSKHNVLIYMPWQNDIGLLAITAFYTCSNFIIMIFKLWYMNWILAPYKQSSTVVMSSKWKQQKSEIPMNIMILFDSFQDNNTCNRYRSKRNIIQRKRIFDHSNIYHMCQ